MALDDEMSMRRRRQKGPAPGWGPYIVRSTVSDQGEGPHHDRGQHPLLDVENHLDDAMPSVLAPHPPVPRRQQGHRYSIANKDATGLCESLRSSVLSYPGLLNYGGVGGVVLS